MSKTHLLILATLLAVSCSSQGNKTDEPLIPCVNVDTLRTEGASATLQYPGRVKASEELSLSFKVSGRVERVYVKEGDYVKAGQTLALLDSTDYKVQLMATEAEYARISAESDRVIKLYEDHAATANDYDKAVFGKQQMEAKLRNHRYQLSYTRLKAPVSGYVQDKLFSSGEMVSAGMPVISLLGARRPEVEINLSAADYARKASFREFTCRFDLEPGRTFRLSPVSVSPKANANQLYTMRLALKGDGSLPSPGMNTMVTISVSSEGGITQYIVPTGSVLHEAESTCAFVYDPDSHLVSARPVKVERLLTDGRCIISSEKVYDGDLFVTSGVHHIRDGHAVRVLPAVSKTNVGGLL